MISGSTVADAESAILSNFELLDRLCADLSFVPEISGVVKKTLPKIRQKHESPKLVMAVMGEFSAGKSTLINAILGEPILTAKVKPTTAILTFIRYGKRPSASVFLPSGASKQVRPDELEPYLTGNIDVARVELAFPNPLLRQGLVIIDTPGSNVDNPAHVQRARDAISEANCCMFVFDGKQPFSRSSAEYLDEVRRNIFKFVFVMTKADELDDDEVEDAREYARSQIASRMNDNTTEVVAVSAKRALHGERELSNVDCLWNTLQQIMIKDKNRVILNEILVLERNLLGSADSVLKTKEQLYDDEMRRLLGREITVSGIREDALSFVTENADMLVHSSRRLYEVSRAQEIKACRHTLLEMVYKASNLNELKANAKGIEAGIETMASEFTKMLDRALYACCQQAASDTKDHFQRVFLDLKKMRDRVTTSRRLLFRWVAIAAVGLATALGAYLLIPQRLSAVKIWISLLLALATSAFTTAVTARPDIVTVGLRSITLTPSTVMPNLESKAFTAVGIDAGTTTYGGAIVGAGIGTVIGGPIGGLLGGAIGAVLGAGAGTSLDSAKQKLADKVNASIDEIDSLTATQSAHAWEKLRSSLTRQLSTQVDNAMGGYSRLLDEVLRHQVCQRQLVKGQRAAVTDARRCLAAAMERTDRAIRTCRR